MNGELLGQEVLKHGLVIYFVFMPYYFRTKLTMIRKIHQKTLDRFGELHTLSCYLLGYKHELIDF